MGLVNLVQFDPINRLIPLSLIPLDFLTIPIPPSKEFKNDCASMEFSYVRQAGVSQGPLC